MPFSILSIAAKVVFVRPDILWYITFYVNFLDIAVSGVLWWKPGNVYICIVMFLFFFHKPIGCWRPPFWMGGMMEVFQLNWIDYKSICETHHGIWKPLYFVSLLWRLQSWLCSNSCGRLALDRDVHPFVSFNALMLDSPWSETVSRGKLSYFTF